ncbi:MAG: HAMP domain-containing histidine kinase [Clostridia bacterium]|nr:HAMP domain-containing histidine kinase [Clostridia bacterium]
MKQSKFQKNLFKKYLTVAGVFTAVCLIIFGVVITSFFSNFWIKEQYTTLERSADSVSRQISFMKGQNLNNINYITAVSAEAGRSMGGYVFVTDRTGKIVTSNLTDAAAHGKSVPSWVLKSSLQGGFNGMTDMNGILNSRCFFASNVITDSDSNIVGVVYTGISATKLSSYIGRLVIIFVSVSILIMLMVTAGVYILALQIVRPLREMGAAAKRMAMGDFSTKIKVTRNDELGRLEEAFNEMAEAVSRSEGSRRGFIANVSHELKTPLTTISGFIDGILDGTIDAENERKYLSIVSGEVKRMNTLVMSMFNLSRLESGAMKPDFKDIDPARTIVAVILSFEKRINDKNIDIVGLEELGSFIVSADEGLLHQAIYNIVDNAVKFTPNDGVINVWCEQKEDKVSIRIRNTCNGIPAGELSKLFDRFYKTDTSRGIDKTGAGLGLSLVKTVVDLHSGSITVRSAEGSFAEFEILLNEVGQRALPEAKHTEKKRKSSENKKA